MKEKKIIFKEFFSLCYPRGYSRVPSKNVSPFGPAFWPAIANIYIYMSEELYIDILFLIFTGLVTRFYHYRVFENY